MKHNLVPANRNETVLIRDDSQHLVHVLLSKVNYNPNDPRVNSTFSRVVTYTPARFEQLEKMQYDRISIDWVKAAGFEKATVVHDGRLWSKAQKEKPVEEPKETIDEKPVEKTVDEKIKSAVTDAVKKERRKANYREGLKKTAK